MIMVLLFLIKVACATIEPQVLLSLQNVTGFLSFAFALMLWHNKKSRSLILFFLRGVGRCLADLDVLCTVASVTAAAVIGTIVAVLWYVIANVWFHFRDARFRFDELLRKMEASDRVSIPQPSQIPVAQRPLLLKQSPRLRINRLSF